MTTENLEIVADEHLENTVEETSNITDTSTSEESKSDVTKVENELPKGIKKRFGVLTQRNKMLEEELYAIKQQLNQKHEPKISRDEMTDDEWIAYNVNKEIQKREHQRYLQEQAKQEAQLKNQKMQSKIEEYKSIVPDITEVLTESADLPLPQSALSFLQDSDIAPLLAYKLATDDELYDKVMEAQHDRTGKKMERLLTKIELKLEAELESKKSTVKVAQTKSTPIGQVTPKGKNVSAETFDPSKLSMSEYRKWRESNKK